MQGATCLQRCRCEFVLSSSREVDVAGFAAVEAGVDAGEIQAVAVVQRLDHHLTTPSVDAAHTRLPVQHRTTQAKLARTLEEPDLNPPQKAS